ncbi:MAG: acyltransferase [Pseudomonadota bacterium]
MRTPSATAAAPERLRFLELDTLRGVATLFIVAAHIELDPLFWTWSLMDMFFVLSSFLLTRIVYDKCADARGVIAFYGRRIERIWPLYFLTVSVLFVIAILINARYHAAVYDLTAFARLYSFSQYSEMLFHPVGGDSTISYARHLWSLAIEEQFYVLLPLAILLLRRLPPLLGVALLVGVIAFSISQRAANPNMYILTSHADAFALGSLLALGFPLLSTHSAVAKRLLWAAALLSLGGFAIYLAEGYGRLLAGQPALLYAAWPATLSTLFWTAAIGLLALYRGHARLAAMRLPPLINLGYMSYAIYLVHYPMLRLLPNVMTARIPGLSTFVAELLCLPLIWFLADFLYRKIDRPLQQRRAPDLSGRKPRDAVTA